MSPDIVGTRWRHRRNTDPTLDVIVLAVVESHGTEYVVFDSLDGSYSLMVARLEHFQPDWSQVEP